MEREGAVAGIGREPRARLCSLPWAAVTVLVGFLTTPVAAEEFEVLVLRGSTIARVAGDETGPLSEVTIREDPYPAPPPSAPDARPFEPEVVIRIEPGEPERVPSAVWLYPRHPLLPYPPPRYHLHDWGSRHRRGPERLGGRPPRSVLFSGSRGSRPQGR